MKQWNWKKIFSTAMVFAAAFTLGRIAAVVNTGRKVPALDALAKISSDISVKMSAESSEGALSETSAESLDGIPAETSAKSSDGASDEASMVLSDETSVETAADGNWGLSFPEEGQPPTANASMEELEKFDTYYAQDTSEKRIYLTFDCGYENGNTPAILDALKKHKAPGTFFAVGNFVSDNPELIKRMAEEGHVVGNHTFSHPDMSKISTQETFSEELSKVEELYKEITGTEMTKYYRPPQGKYSEANLQMAKDMGYKTFFWSLAYVDWMQDQQPTREEAFEKLLGRIHPGAIVLLHNTSSTNGQILDELLSKWEEMGYTFHPLEELWQ